MRPKSVILLSARQRYYTSSTKCSNTVSTRLLAIACPTAVAPESVSSQFASHSLFNYTWFATDWVWPHFESCPSIPTPEHPSWYILLCTITICKINKYTGFTNCGRIIRWLVYQFCNLRKRLTCLIHLNWLFDYEKLFKRLTSVLSSLWHHPPRPFLHHSYFLWLS